MICMSGLRRLFQRLQQRQVAYLGMPESAKWVARGLSRCVDEPLNSRFATGRLRNTKGASD